MYYQYTPVSITSRRPVVHAMRVDPDAPGLTLFTGCGRDPTAFTRRPDAEVTCRRCAAWLVRWQPVRAL